MHSFKIKARSSLKNPMNYFFKITKYRGLGKCKKKLIVLLQISSEQKNTEKPLEKKKLALSMA